MANSKSNNDYYHYATVDADPTASGYFCDPVNPETIHRKYNFNLMYVFFSVRGSGSMTVTLQFKCPGDSDWTDYDTYASNTRELIECGIGGVQWRAGVTASANYTSGEKTFGIDW